MQTLDTQTGGCAVKYLSAPHSTGGTCDADDWLSSASSSSSSSGPPHFLWGWWRRETSLSVKVELSSVCTSLCLLNGHPLCSFCLTHCPRTRHSLGSAALHGAKLRDKLLGSPGKEGTDCNGALSAWPARGSLLRSMGGTVGER